MVHGHISANKAGLPNDNTHPVIDEEARADFCARMDLDARQEPAHPCKDMRKPKQSSTMQSMGQAVKCDSMKPWIE